ncbi:MAG: FAD-binding oxidoreductase, partial [Flammeovirgaceae bacterium]|nr:FAD-binding oxidoreductase [Flammeovirgaceae bacterium]MDW8288893.1 FAD-binding oxidoreductase [Flammeovirgaceae bacterium]
VEDIRKLIFFAQKHRTSLIPRTAGTSLAGQVVGSGIVVDVSRHFTKILEVNPKESWVRVQPGVIRDELNMFLKEHGLYFGPETSTANRAMIGGMVGNNSCGSNSIVYGSTREHVLEIKALLSSGEEVTFRPLTKAEFHAKCQDKSSLEGELYRHIFRLLSPQEVQEEIRREFPKPSIPRRNTGYAIDLLLDSEVFDENSRHPFNFCKLIAGSEGTLCFITEIKLNCVPLPPKHKALVCAHFHSVDESLRANLIAVRYQPSASELIDHYILECTKTNIEQRKNRFFVKDDPGAILVIEIARESMEEVNSTIAAMVAEMQKAGLGYHFPVLTDDDMKKIWDLRKAGLGLLSNIPGDSKPVAVIEDTAVDVNDLPDFIREFNE